MNPRLVLTPIAIAALATAPLAATSAATAGGIPTNHNQTFKDTDEQKPAASVNIISTHVFRTAMDYRAVVTYQLYSAPKATRYTVFLDGETKTGGGDSGNVLDLRINPSGKASVVGYGIDDEGLVKSGCQGNKVYSGKNTLTFVIAKKCWYSQTSPDIVEVGTKHYASASDYADGTPLDYRAGDTDEDGSRDQSSNIPTGRWNWGGPPASDQ